MIPKRIFYVWGANEKKPRAVQVCVQTWRQIMPDYEIIEINENNTKYFDFKKELKNNKWFKTVYENKLFAYISDYIRIKVLYEHGGIYFDTDVSAVRKLDDMLENDCFVGMQNEKYVEPAILGACKYNKLLEKVLDFYNEQKNENIWTLPIFTMPQIFEHFFIKMYDIHGFPEKKSQKIISLSDITIYPERYFIPFRCSDVFSPECVEEDTRTIHWFGGSWQKPEIVTWLKNKHINRDTTLLKIQSPTVKRYKLIGNNTILKICSTNKECNVYFLHIPLFKVNDKGIYLFKWIRLFKTK